VVLLLHETKDAYRHRQRDEYVIEKAEYCACYVSKLQEKCGEEKWQNFLWKDHLVNSVCKVSIEAIKEILQNLSSIDVLSFIENVIEESVEVQETRRVVGSPILSFEFCIIILLLFDMYVDLFHIRSPIHRYIRDECDDNHALKERQDSKVA
jgi:hypothetical protein